MPSFPFFNSSKRKEKRAFSNASQTSSAASSSAFSSRSNTPDLIPPTFPQFARRGSEPATPQSHGLRSRPPPIVHYTPVGPSIGTGPSGAVLQSPRLTRRGSDNVTTSPRKRLLLPVSPARVLSPPLPPHPAVASSLTPPQYAAGYAGSFNQPRSLTPTPEQLRSRSFGMQAEMTPRSVLSASGPARTPTRPPRLDLDEYDDDFLAPPPRRLFVGAPTKVPELDEVWSVFLEDAEEDADSLNELPPQPRRRARSPVPPVINVIQATEPADPAPVPQRPNGLMRAFSEPPTRALPSTPLQESFSLQASPEIISKPITPPATPAHPRYRVPSLSPLEALDVSLSMARGFPSAGSKSSLASGLSSAPSTLSVMSLQDALNYSISLSAFPKPPALDAVQEEAVHKVEVEGELVELPYLSHLPTPPISPPALVSIGRTGTLRARASTPTFNQGRIAIPSFGTIMDASKTLEEPAPIDDRESSSDESFALSQFSPSSANSSAHHRRTVDRNDSFSSISSASDVVQDFSDDEDDCQSTDPYDEHTLHIMPRGSPRPSFEFDEVQPQRRDSFEFDDPQPMKKAPTRPVTPMMVSKERMQMDLPTLPFVTNMDIGSLTPKVSANRSPSLFHVGWSPAPGTVEYGYAV
ncbi:hypothetical protein DACRYDRAFT_97767 [Dacryopinax primogenitus]|uniref:Uncharacterized protein n=1 Tax=Dacryopinax primogenitus (strain DJM 731) TaxID=1858805 RepID=M5GCI6_DACPD|nr:uncharacterized protein DACRYDRAFT_97767 [Dacryopinax primogenitus]EJU06230.1 hypothetical protein DACRYDRAFT_97767 [Dacryopinax primogenitus]